MECNFKEVGDDDMDKVLTVLQKNWPKHFVTYQTLTTLKEFEKSQCQLKSTVYLYGDFETGVYIIKVTLPTPDEPMHCINLYSPANNLDAVEYVLQHSPAIPWNRESFLFETIPSGYRALVERAFVNKGIRCLTKPNMMLVFPPEAALILTELPADVCVAFLKDQHVGEVDKNWPHRYKSSLHLHRDCITKYFGIGVFRKSDDKMVCSSISNYTGGIFVLYTDPEFRGKGLASIVVQYMIKEIRRRGKVPFCTINSGNAPSLKVFRRLGFKYVHMVDYYRIIQYFTVFIYLGNHFRRPIRTILLINRHMPSKAEGQGKWFFL